jgi:hypothetical protein
LRTSPIDQNPAYDSSTDPVPDMVNERSERARSVVAHEDGFVVFGEREYRDDGNKLYTRATVQRYTSIGLREGALWTSPGLKFLHDAVLTATSTETGFIAAGWCRHGSGSSRVM